MRGRLNLFQAAMLRWRASYPYNAVHVAELPGILDASRLSQAIDAHLTDLGIGRLALDPKRQRYEFATGPVHVDVPVIAAGDDARAVLEREMERYLNAPFEGEGEFEPLRFFVVANGSSFHLGVAYDHFIAGGDSIVALLKGIASRYAGTLPPRRDAVELYPPTYAPLFAKHALAFYVGQYLLPGMLLRSRRAYRPRYPHGDGKHNAFTSFDLSKDAYAGIVRAARAWKVTRNDLMLAMMLWAVSPEVESRRGAGRRNEIALASVINLRDMIAAAPDRSFGQFLSSFLVSHPVPEGIGLESLARDVHAQTQRVKSRRLYLQTLFLMACGGLAWQFMTPEQHKHMDAKNYPVWGGLSALNVESIWNRSPGDAPVLHYLRAVSTGPVSPLLVAPASIGDSLTIGVTYRPSAFTRDDVQRIDDRLLGCAMGLA